MPKNNNINNSRLVLLDTNTIFNMIDVGKEYALNGRSGVQNYINKTGRETGKYRKNLISHIGQVFNQFASDPVINNCSNPRLINAYNHVKQSYDNTNDKYEKATWLEYMSGLTKHYLGDIKNKLNRDLNTGNISEDQYNNAIDTLYSLKRSINDDYDQYNDQFQYCKAAKLYRDKIDNKLRLVVSEPIEKEVCAHTLGLGTNRQLKFLKKNNGKIYDRGEMNNVMSQCDLLVVKSKKANKVIKDLSLYNIEELKYDRTGNPVISDEYNKIQKKNRRLVKKSGFFKLGKIDGKPLNTKYNKKVLVDGNVIERRIPTQPMRCEISKAGVLGDSCLQATKAVTGIPIVTENRKHYKGQLSNNYTNEHITLREIEGMNEIEEHCKLCAKEYLNSDGSIPQGEEHSDMTTTAETYSMSKLVEGDEVKNLTVTPNPQFTITNVKTTSKKFDYDKTYEVNDAPQQQQEMSSTHNNTLSNNATTPASSIAPNISNTSTASANSSTSTNPTAPTTPSTNSSSLGMGMGG